VNGKVVGTPGDGLTKASAVGPGSAPRDFAALVPLRSARPHRHEMELRTLFIVVAPRSRGISNCR
jgi:hypothetical protein